MWLITYQPNASMGAAVLPPRTIVSELDPFDFLVDARVRRDEVHAILFAQRIEPERVTEPILDAMGEW